MRPCLPLLDTVFIIFRRVHSPEISKLCDWESVSSKALMQSPLTASFPCRWHHQQAYAWMNVYSEIPKIHCIHTHDRTCTCQVRHIFDNSISWVNPWHCGVCNPEGQDTPNETKKLQWLINWKYSNNLCKIHIQSCLVYLIFGIPFFYLTHAFAWERIWYMVNCFVSPVIHASVSAHHFWAPNKPVL